MFDEASEEFAYHSTEYQSTPALALEDFSKLGTGLAPSDFM